MVRSDERAPVEGGEGQRTQGLVNEKEGSDSSSHLCPSCCRPASRISVFSAPRMSTGSPLHATNQGREDPARLSGQEWSGLSLSLSLPPTPLSLSPPLSLSLSLSRSLALALCIYESVRACVNVRVRAKVYEHE